MEQQIYFIIKNNELVLDKVLVEYNEEPIFFVCKHEEDYYIALCADGKEERYIVTQTSLKRLSDMLHERMTMREVILRADKFWDIVAGEDVTEDIVIEKNIDQIPLDVLPYEGAYLKVATRELKEYEENIDSLLFNNGKWEKTISHKYTEYVEELVRSFYEQYETVFQNIYESVVDPVRSDYMNICGETDYSKEICNLKVQIGDLSAGLGVAIDNNDNFPFAA